MSVKRFPNSAAPSELASVIEEDGGAIVKGFLSPSLLEHLKKDLLPMLETTPNGVDEYFAGTQTRRLSRLFARTDHMVDVALNPLYLETARLILQKPIKLWSGENQVEVAPDIQVGVTQAIQIRPGQGMQPLHRDDSVWLWRHPWLQAGSSRADHDRHHRFLRRERRDLGHPGQPQVG
ncbi:phytanoyl-CoA dioxygenase family protein [Ralstonia sp. GP71]|uniref:phytanoyl-CoA dioxygenase family protein n=1 Tax=Ralstonia sp. GP71 TaxID=3035152 RepID=UPI0038916248